MFFYVSLDKYKFLGCIVMLFNREIKDIYARYCSVVVGLKLMSLVVNFLCADVSFYYQHQVHIDWDP